MLTLHVRCIHCKYDTWIPVGEWTTLCPLCGRHGVYKVESKPRIGVEDAEDDNSKG